MEMPSDQLVMRMLSSLGRIDQTRMRTGDMHDDDWPRFTSAVSQLKDKPLYFDDSPALTPNEVRTRARRVAREAGGLEADRRRLPAADARESRSRQQPHRRDHRNLAFAESDREGDALPDGGVRSSIAAWRAATTSGR